MSEVPLEPACDQPDCHGGWQRHVICAACESGNGGVCSCRFRCPTCKQDLGVGLVRHALPAAGGLNQ